MNLLYTKISAFTLAEVIIVLGIIGIVAMLALPDLITTTQDAEYKTGKDEVRMSIAEAGRVLSVNGDIASGTSAEDFVKNYLSKQLKIMKFCDPSTPASMEQCGMPSGSITKFKNLDNAIVATMPTTWKTITNPYGVAGPAKTMIINGKPYTAAPYYIDNPTTKNFNNSYVFLTSGGIAVNLFYNPYCSSNSSEKPYQPGVELALDRACMGGVYDMNGLKKPNQVGKDIGFFGVFHNGAQTTSASVLPARYTNYVVNTWTFVNSYCGGLKGYKLPTLDEFNALFLGFNITGIKLGPYHWTSSQSPVVDGSWTVNPTNGMTSNSERIYSGNGVQCVRN